MMKLIRYNYPEFTDLFSDFDRFFRNSFGRLPVGGQFPSLADSVGVSAPRLAADLYEDDQNYYTRVELPGAKREDLKVELENSTLTISYERKAEGDDEPEAVTYTRSLSVPEGVEGDRVSASLKNGILTVTLPRSERKTPKEIVIE